MYDDLTSDLILCEMDEDKLISREQKAPTYKLKVYPFEISLAYDIRSGEDYPVQKYFKKCSFHNQLPT